MEARATWIGDRRFVGEAGSGHAIIVDAGADKIGPSPMELLLVGLAGCTGYDVVSILEKKRQEVSGLTVSVRGERAPEPPAVFVDISVEYIVRGRNLSAKAVADAIRLSEEKYCSASVMLGKTARISTSYRIEEA